ncbi:unnamed protein product [Paramecium primaurelia]|uniref:Uncharacterized protein n=1 Tax=Paramecium primaurelia TaxID=5886 RepID=A0A8S1Q4B3_PARPR|nr:unnamed protein product [Paramecium primaurelia]
MGNCETSNTVIGDPQFQQIGSEAQARNFSSTYKSEYVEVHGNLAVVEEQEEGGLVLLDEPAKEQDILKVKICCDTIQTSIGIGIVDFDIVKETDFSGNCNYGLDHGMWIVYSDKLVAASNDEDLDKKSLGIEVKQGDIIECIRNGNVFSIRKAGENNKQINFKLPPNKNYRFAAYLFSGWDSKEAKVSEARMETL